MSDIGFILLDGTDFSMVPMHAIANSDTTVVASANCWMERHRNPVRPPQDNPPASQAGVRIRCRKKRSSDATRLARNSSDLRHALFESQPALCMAIETAQSCWFVAGGPEIRRRNGSRWPHRVATTFLIIVSESRTTSCFSRLFSILRHSIACFIFASRSTSLPA